MPRKKPEPAAPTVVTVTPAPASIAIPDDESSGWSAFASQFGQDADVTISVYAEPANGQGGAAFLFKVNASDFPDPDELLPHIRNHPDGGPGLYSLRAKRGTRFIGAPRVRIGGRRPPEAPAPVVAPAPAPAAPSGEASEFTKFLQTMVITLMGKPAPAAPQGPGFSDVIEAAKLMAGSGKERTPISELKELLSLRDLLQPNRGDGDEASADSNPWSELIKTFGPTLLQHATTPPVTPAVPMQQLAPPRPNPMPPPSGPPAAVSRPAAAPSAAAPQGPGNPLAPLLGLLMRGAQSDGDPGSYASVALDLLGDYAPMLLGRPDALDQIMAMAPVAVPYREWFAELLREASEMLAADAADNEAGVGAGAAGGGLTGTETGPDGRVHVAGEPTPVP